MYTTANNSSNNYDNDDEPVGHYYMPRGVRPDFMAHGAAGFRSFKVQQVIYLSSYLSIYLHIYLSIYLSIYPSIYLSISLSILYIYYLSNTYIYI